MYTIFNGVAYECRRLRFGLLLTVTATECLTRRSSVSPCEIILLSMLFVQVLKNKRKVPHRVQTGGQRPTLYSAPPPQAALPQVVNLEEMIGGHSCSHNLSSDLSSFQQRMHLTPKGDCCAFVNICINSIQYIADPGGALWGPSSALSARTERKK